MRIAEIVIRSLLGLWLAFAGSSKFFPIEEPEMSAGAAELISGLMAAKFVMPTVGLVEILAGILLITGRMKAFTYMLLLPIVYGILAFHVAADDVSNIAGGAILAVMYITLIVMNKEKIKPLFK